MSVFDEVKAHCTAKEAAEYYGLKVSPKGMACCPFHNDHHPSMKIDSFYYCFACGAKGDAVSYVAQMFGLNPYEAACKLATDLHLPVEIGKKRTNSKEYWRTVQNNKHKEVLRRRFDKWCFDSINYLKCASSEIAKQKQYYQSQLGMEALDDERFCELICRNVDIQRWLDILCTGTMEEKMELFIQKRKEVDAYGGRGKESE